MSVIRKISRLKLYEQVWSQPMMHLASKYGISDVALAKICRKNNIPRPPVGYWAKKQAGQTLQQITLPNPEDDRQIEIRDHGNVGHSQSSPTNADQPLIEAAKQLLISVPVHLENAHPMVRKAKAQLERAKVGEAGVLNAPEGLAIVLNVTMATLDRSLRISDAIIKNLERHGYAVSKGSTVSIFDTALEFNISEQIEVRKIQPQDHDLEGRYSFGHSHFEVTKTATGRLSLNIDGGSLEWGHHFRKSWRDGDKQRLEDKLGDFLPGMIQLARKKQDRLDELNKQAEIRRTAESKRQEAANQLTERRKLYKLEKKRFAELVHQSSNWKQSQTIRQFLDAAKQCHLQSRGPIEPDSEFGIWLQWATSHADRLDPFVESAHSILDEDLEEPENPYQRWGR